jgi:TolB-like protein/tetratricopeptide (TPR) repeat protein
LDALESGAPLPHVKDAAARPPRKASRRQIAEHAGISRRLWIGTAATAAVVSGVGAVGLLGTSDPPFTSSILVFPFQNLTKTQEYNHLCVGTVEELTRRLTYLPGLNVYPIPKFWSPDPSAIKKAQFSLKGSLQHLEDKIRLSVRLTENDSGAVVWTETFDRTLVNPLALESEIAEKTVGGMRRRVAENSSLLSRIRVIASDHLGGPLRRALGPQTLLPNQATGSSVAFDEYQRGRELCQTRTLPAALEAMNRFQRAIDRDPNFALAYAAMADVHPILLNYNYAPTLQLLSDALRYSEKGVELNQSLPECHTARGAARQNLWDWEESDSSYRAAIEKHPKFARAHHWYAGLIHQFGRFDEALERARKGLELDPFDYPAQSNYGLYLWNAGRLKDAAAQLESVLEKADLVYAHNVLGQVYAALAASSTKGEATEYFVRSLGQAATVRLRDIEASGGSDPGYLKWSDSICTQAYAARGDHASAQHFVTRLERGFDAGKISASALAWAHAAVGNRNRTLELLEHGLEQRERELLNIRVIPLFRPLHSERRFNRILQRMKLA